ncbi:activated leukocyte cell adhesion molecule b isoform X2 [Salminus brasiliensis]|uniref:activated leukocyte cell adhesion molecule b isoform X2 n=1 Tax=Salminus brasiliensis TaxID=930266 RepID=UPI003B839486
MRLTVFSATALLVISVLETVRGFETIVGQYGKTIEVPCNIENAKLEDIFLTKWKYTNADRSTGDLLKARGQNVTITADVEYLGRVSLTENLSLRIAQAKLSDQRMYTCMVVIGTDIFEYPVQVTILKTPSGPMIANQAKEMEIGKLTLLGECSTKDANPAAKVVWLKNNISLESDEKVIKITTTVQTDKTTGLASTSSTLEYAAVKGDLNAKFVCAVQHKSLTSDLLSTPVEFIINYPTEKVSLQVISADPIKEGDNVTLKCKADGNPPPSSYSFHIKGKKVKVENSDSYTLTSVTRANTGEYKCSLVDNDAMAASVNITVMYLDITSIANGKVVKQLDESFEPTLVVNASGKPQVSWSKNNARWKSPLKFDKLKYSDSGVYECVVSMAGLVRKASFELIVQGAPVINKLTKRRSNNGNFKVLSCEAEGSPKPTVQWSINGTNATETPYVEGRVTHRITIIPTVNLTVNCTVSNELGQASKSLDVSTLFEEVTVDKQEDSADQTRVAVGVVIGVILAAVAIGLIYWIYMKRTRQGTWKTGEKEDGTQEESKKLEENQSQKAEV